MKTLTTTFEEILKANKVEASFPEGVNLLSDLINAVSEYNKKVVGENEKVSSELNEWSIKNQGKNEAKTEIRNRQKELL